MKQSQPVKKQRVLAAFVGFFAACIGASGHAASFPDFPLQTGTGSIPPNIMFILDDSGSMGWPTMPANVYHINGRSQDTPTRRSYINNTIYYNPAIDYRPWLLADGFTRMAGGDRYPNVYLHNTQAGPDVATIDLSDPTSCGEVVTNTTAEYCGGGLIDIYKGFEDGSNYTSQGYHSQTFYVPKEGVQIPSSNNDYYKYTITANGQMWRTEFGSGNSYEWRRNPTMTTPTLPDGTRRSPKDELDNYATWFSYHRTRMKAAKAGASEAFGSLGPHFRVGYDSIWRRGNKKSAVGDNNTAETALPAFPIPVGDNGGRFEGDNRKTWFDLLFAAPASGNTPLRRALTRTGNYYEHQRGADGPWGPGPTSEQLSCRQSFAILTSDGHWNRSTPSIVSDSQLDIDSEAGPEITSADGETTWQYDPTEPENAAFPDPQKGTLGDVAMHFWKRDLNPDLANNVPSSTKNPAFWQHMSTFAISIGLKGTVDQTSVAGVMEEGGVTIGGVKQTGWPNPVVPNSESNRRIDDMLHAAVNGRGEFVAASSPQDFADALQSSLQLIANRQAAGAAVATNGPSISTKSMLFQATYTAGEWSGDLLGIPVVAGGAIGASPTWSMAAVANAHPDEFYGRNVWTANASGSGRAFPTNTQEAQLAREPHLPRGVSGADNANYIKGRRAREGTSPTQLRRRESPIGTIVNSSPFYVQESETVFLGANDGMLHAVDATNGTVRFSYVPRGLNFGRLAHLSSQDYQHNFFVDGGIDVTTHVQSLDGDKNILVASLGRGGKGLFGLDVTTPSGTASQIVNWDRTFQGEGGSEEELHTGYILGAPLVRKGNNGALLAIYGNGIDSSEGSASLFIRNAETGTLYKRIEVDTSGGNGLSAVRAADVDGNGTADVIYAGDLKGNVWKFDITSTTPANWDAARSGSAVRPLFTATGPDGSPQPITASVALAQEPGVGLTGRVFVLFGTGSYITNGDLTDTRVQSIYAVIDEDGPNSVAALDRGDLQKRTIPIVGQDALGRSARAWEPFSELDESKKGWFVDLDEPSIGERVVSTPVIRGRALWFASIIPEMGQGCDVGGTGYLNALDVFTGTNPGRADGSSYSFIDVNRDGEGDDYLDGYADGDIGLVTSVDLGIGMPSVPSFIGDDAYSQGSDARLGRLSGIASGARPQRLRWHELVGQE